MLAKLCITPPNSRAGLIAAIEQSSSITPSAIGTKISHLLRQELLSPSDIVDALGGGAAKSIFDSLQTSHTEWTTLSQREMQLMGYPALYTLDSLSWARLMLLCNKCTDNTFLYALAQQLLLDSKAPAQAQLNAYYFLISQNQMIRFTFESKVISALVQSRNIEDWAILLSNEDTHAPILTQLASLSDLNINYLLQLAEWTKANNVSQKLRKNVLVFSLTFLSTLDQFAVTDLPIFISWIAKNDKDNLNSIIVYALELENSDITNTLVQCALEGVIKLKQLQEIFTLPNYEQRGDGPLFDIVFFDRNFEAPNQSGEAFMEKALTRLENLKNQFPKKLDELFSLFIAPTLRKHPDILLFTAQLILDKYSYLSEALTPLASAMPVTQEATLSLANQALFLAETWDFKAKFNSKRDQEHETVKYNNYSKETKEKVDFDLTKNVVRDIIGQLILILTIPKVWDHIIETNSEQFAYHLEIILSYNTYDFFRSASALPWDKSQNNQRICSDKTIDWLFKLDCMRTLSFIQPHDQSFSAKGEIYLKNLLRANDDYVIKKLYEANANADFVLFSGLTKIGNYKEIEHVVVPLLTHPDFQIEKYYVDASETFKQFSSVLAAIQLKYVFHPETIGPLVSEDPRITSIKEIHHVDVFLSELQHRNQDNLIVMRNGLAAIDPMKFTDETNNPDAELYKRARTLYKQIKQLPSETKKILNQDMLFVTFTLAIRILKDARVNNPTGTVKQITRGMKKLFTQTTKGHEWVGKDVKLPFLHYILSHLTLFGCCSSQNTTSPEAPFIWNAYVESYLPLKKGTAFKKEEQQYSSEKIADVNQWLNEQILDKIEAKETMTLSLLPKVVLDALFTGAIIKSNEMKSRLKQIVTPNVTATAIELDESSRISSESDSDNEEPERPKSALLSPVFNTSNNFYSSPPPAILIPPEKPPKPVRYKPLS